MTSHADRPTRVAIVGAGNVGSTFAFSLLLSGLAAEIVLIDTARERAEGEAMDLAHSVPFSRPTRIRAGDYADCAGSAITVIAAGAAQRPGETRLDLARKNAAIFGSIVPRIVEHNPDGIILVATNPVDVLTYATIRLSGLPPRRVIGTGTILDTARFRALLAAHFGVDPRSVHAFIVGEHGDSEVAVWSLANIAGTHLADFAAQHDVAFDAATRDAIFTSVRDAAYEIIRRKDATFYAVAVGLTRLVEAILRDQHTVLSVSSLIDGPFDLRDVCLSLPSVVARGGVELVLRQELDPDELAGLRRSAGILRDEIEALDLPAVPA